eukprot:TRINITY_DN8156_c0_g1_i3.p1 TRINITY_DN8156_c0_g1~~TRINITY_DN8156_c0_g1_i3.p1  ORF type:complete len:379 (+),score=75.47 TRINITY_DN8156_c0_g1_i3:657-1793(+)
MVFVGNSGQKITDHCGLGPGSLLPYTVVPTTPVIAEKPYIVLSSSGQYVLRVPKVEINKVGPTTDWDNVDEYDFSQVYVATDSDTASVINSKLASGLHVVLTPGNYFLSESLTITHPNTVILGIGFPTLVPTQGNPLIHVTDVEGVRVAGILFDAGPVKSQNQILWGDSTNFGNPSNPGIAQDLFGRVGGSNNPNVQQVSTVVMVTINQRHVIVDNAWLWRADHDITGGGVYSLDNPSDNGLVVNGDGVVAYGLAVEHQLKDAVVWNGEGGESYFYQCELPYDVNQQNFGDPGYCGYKVGSKVNQHSSWGAGVYCFFRDNIVTVRSAILAPSGGGVSFVHPFTKFLNGNGQINHVLNGLGSPVNISGAGLSYVCSTPK